MDGLGVLTYPYGEKSVVGEWKNGKEWDTKNKNKEGKLLGKFENGEWIGNMGVLYIGKRNGESGWYEEKWEGVESEDNKDLSKYEGGIINGRPNGKGTFINSSGSKYVGENKDGIEHGQGTKTWSDGTKLVGEFKYGSLNGQGTQIFPNGTKYVGEFKYDFLNGQGTQIFPDGRKYVGEFKDGEM